MNTVDHQKGRCAKHLGRTISDASWKKKEEINCNINVPQAIMLFFKLLYSVENIFIIEEKNTNYPIAVLPELSSIES